MGNSPERLFTIGRLDRDTTGAILVTNDGELANQLMHPKNQIERVYIVTSKIDIHRNQQLKLATGLDLDDRSKVKGTLQRINKRGGLIYWRVILNEGKNHEVKRIFKALGSRVIHLHRHSIAGLEIDAILPVKYQLLKEKDIQKLKKQIPI